MRIIVAFLLFSLLSQTQVPAQKLDVKKYDFTLELSDQNDEIVGEAIIDLVLFESTPSFSLQLVKKQDKTGMRVTRVFVNGLPSCFHFGEDDRVYVKNNTGNWPHNIPLQVKIEYFGIPGDGLIISDNKFGSRSFFGDNWPDRAHHWLPVIDHPSDKAEVEFKIIAPQHYEIIASGALIERINLSDGKSLHHFKSKQEYPTKVMVLAASEFKVTPYDTLKGVPISSWIYEENKTGEMDYLPSVAVFQFFSDTIGDYIYPKLVNVQSKTRYGGMENAGNIFYFENSVNGKNEVEALIAHEVAHQWFGNACTEKDWPHIWLSEGFATYMTDLYWEHKYGAEAFWKRLEKERKAVINFGKKRSALVVDSTVNDLMYLLNPNSYQKGAWVLHMLRNEIGDDLFFRVMQEYYDKYKYSNAETADFIETAERISGKDLGVFFRQWLYSEMNPDFEITWFIEEDERLKDKMLILKVKQKHEDHLFQLTLDVLFGQDLFSLTIDQEDNYFVLPVFKGHSPVWDPEIKLLYEADIHQRKFDYDSGDSLRFKKWSVREFNQRPITRKIDLSEANILLQPGDLLFQDLDCGPLCEAIESVTQGYRGADFSHVAMVSEMDESRIMVFEAIGGKVRETKLEDFLSRSQDDNGDPKVMIGRVKDQSIKDKALREIKKYEGKAYDDVFIIENDSYYCSELLYFSYLDKGEPIFKLYPMTFKKPNSDDFDPAWIEYYRDLGVDIPEGEPGLNPGGISRSPYVEMLYHFGKPSGYRE
jgi:aminopeptidase N